MTSAYFELALREFGRTPEAEAALRAGTGVDATAPGGEITLGQQLVQIRNLNRRERPGWALRLGNRFEAAPHGPLAFAAVSAPTLADSLAVLERFGYVRAPYFRLTAGRDARRIALAVDERVPLAAEERVPLIELLMLSLQKLVESVLGGPMTDAAFHFAWAPPSYADDYRDCYHGAVRFHARRTALAIPSRWLDLTCPLADPATYRESIRKLEALARRLDGDDYVVARVEQLIVASGDGTPSLAEVAKRLHVSTRTLIRRLRRGGTTYHELVDAHRRERATALLGNRDFGIAEVGHQLGYEDPANFGRACRRWFGMAAGQYRRRLLRGGR